MASAILTLGVAPAFGQRPLGVDVSDYQGGSINWSSVKSTDGITFAWAKATEGLTVNDADFAINAVNAKAAGVLIGAYHFAHPETHLGLAGADSEAAHFWSIAGKYITNGGAYLLPMLDMETDPGTASPVYTKNTLSQWANRWCQDIVNAAASNGVAVKPVIYTGISYSGSWFNSTVTNWPLWMANWPASPNPQTGAPSGNGPWPDWSVWQYTDSNTVSGPIHGWDTDVFNGTSETISNLVIGSLFPPFFTTPLVNSRAVDAGRNASFSAKADGSLPLKYQWTFNGTSLAGATNTTLIISNAQAASAGNYAVIVTNFAGSLTSSVVSLLVYPLQTTIFADNFDVDTATNWTLHRSSSDTAATFNFDYSTLGIPSAPNSTNATTRGLQLKANLANGAVAALSLSPTNQVFAGDYRLHFDAWINVNGPFPNGGIGSTLFLTGGVGTSGTTTEWNGAGSAADGFYFACDGDGGISPGSTGLNDFCVFSGTTVQGSASQDYYAGADATARGADNIYYQSAIPNARSAPALQRSTYPQQTNALDPGTFGLAWHDVIVSKRGSTVDWVVDGIRFATISNATFTANNVFVGFWDPFSSLSSNNVINFGLVDNVRVESPAVAPAFTLQPFAQTVKWGTNLTFTAAATGLPLPAYQWRFNGTNLPGATNASYPLAFVAATNTGNYSVLATNIAGAVASTNALLALAPPSAAQFSAISVAGGVVQIGFTGDAYWPYTIETSTNLMSWSSLTNLTSAGGVFNFTAGPFTNAPQEFFRARVGP
ncbi:MAG: GH25 family lysozyme [Verrucomicrobiae bacterium]|nr:GH25 family lysozyme [Verrucomicrobiae bacterium]